MGFPLTVAAIVTTLLQSGFGSWQGGGDPGVQRPGDSSSLPVLPPGRLRDEETDMEDDGASDTGSDSDVVIGSQAVILTPGDYCERLDSNATGGSVLGVLHAVLGIMGDLWDDGYNELVGAMTSEFRDVDPSRGAKTVLPALHCWREHGSHSILEGLGGPGHSTLERGG